LGIRFLSPTESIDTGADSPMSKFLMHLFAASAEMERGDYPGARLCRGARGEGTGNRPRRVFRRDEGLKLRAEGMSWRSVAKTLNLPTVIDACSESPPKGRRR
jgi:DNA invertase Pin-like site-specific DNA recombinase